MTTPETKARMSRVLDYLVGRSDQIAAAHVDLGIPLEDAICAAVRKAMTTPASAGDAQLNLAFTPPAATARRSRS
jgi:hypothetical protein